MSPALAVLLPLALACKDKGQDSGGGPIIPDPWLDLEPVALEPFRELLRTDLPAAVGPTRLQSLGRVPLSFVLDAEAGQSWVLDARYRHEPEPVCVDISLWPELDPDGERQASCGADQVRADRGSLDPGSQVVAQAADPVRQGLWLLGSDGSLAWSTADPLAGNPLDFLRPQVLTTRELGEGPWGLSTDGAALYLADGDQLLELDEAGQEVASATLDGPALDLVATQAGAWVLTTSGLWAWAGGDLEQVLAADGSGGRLRVEDGTVWASLPAAGLAWSSAGSALSVDGLAGPLAVHGDTLWLALEDDELLRLDGGVETRRHPVEPLVDLLAQDTGELVLLLADHSVAVVVDETGLAGPAPLNATILTFLENPKPEEAEGTGCTDPDTVQRLLNQAADNRRLLEDLPAAIGLGMISEIGRQALLCGEEERLLRDLELDRIGPGLLVWGDESDELSDEAMVVDFLQDQAAPFQELGVQLRWLGSVPRLGSQGADWVQAVAQAGIASDLHFFGMDIQPGVESFDPRAKDPVPWEAATPPTAWRPASADQPLVHDPDGPLLLRPGWELSLYSLSGCANVFLFECKQSNLGGNTIIDEGDLQVMDLLLWRALAMRSDAGPDHWSVHLPDLSKFDYTDGCQRQQRLWVPEEDAACQAGLLQQWSFDVHARYALAGLLEWYVP